MLTQLGPAFRMTALFTVVTGLIYPTAVTGVCQLLFHDQANGSLVVQSGDVRGSMLIAQSFKKPEYFHPRPSAAGNDGYDATASTGFNDGPTSQKLLTRVTSAVQQFHAENPDYKGPVPADAVTGSASGLDPDISLANAEAQIPRVASARHMSADDLRQMIDTAAHSRDLGFLGEARVNVLKLNLALDANKK